MNTRPILGRIDLLTRHNITRCRPNTQISYSTSKTMYDATGDVPTRSLPALSVMPTSLLLRSYFLTSILASPRILKFGLPLMQMIANSKSRLLNPDRNPLLHFLVRKFVYDHFTAGENASEVEKTIREMKRIGFKGVILGYAKEVNITGGENSLDAAKKSVVDASASTIKDWTEGTLKTLRMIGEGDILAVK
jgi:proline dehydrogenase